jgi:hypothetical protein
VWRFWLSLAVLRERYDGCCHDADEEDPDGALALGLDDVACFKRLEDGAIVRTSSTIGAKLGSGWTRAPGSSLALPFKGRKCPHDLAEGRREKGSRRPIDPAYGW